MGRPSKITPTLIEQIAKRVQVGNFPEIAAASCGISRTTYYRWMALGEGHSQAGKQSEYRYFRDAIQKARAECEVVLVTRIMEAVPKEWTAAARMLESLAPERFMRSEKRLVKQEQEERDAPFTISLISKDREDLALGTTAPAAPALAPSNGHSSQNGERG